uniref:M23ase beta-sheet core domain-containing protein n=1 Tax=Magnetococcus massalia (strain MO-1) TaxID=451514 RepID=A0A1S7LIN1_MAGMO|nr:Conserved protein of unknown function. Containing metallopeptidase domain belongs to peptidase family M23 [Candidatus Magnetococcus massalia]
MNLRDRLTITITTYQGARHLHLSIPRLRMVGLMVLVATLVLAATSVLGFYFYKDANTLQNRLSAAKDTLDQAVGHARWLKRESENKDLTITEFQRKYEDAKAEAKRVALQAANVNARVRRFMLTRLPSGRPIDSRKITSPYGERKDPLNNKSEFHGGLDLRAPLGTAVRSTADGVVEYAGFHRRSGYGHLVIIRHDFGFRTAYAHLSKTLVRPGTFVSKGDTIARSGNSGKSSGPHLHYEVRFVHRKLDPTRFIRWSWQNYDTIFEERRVRWQSLVDLLNKRLSDPALQSLQMAQK